MTTNGTYNTRRKITTASITLILLVFSITYNEKISDMFKQTDTIPLFLCLDFVQFVCPLGNI